MLTTYTRTNGTVAFDDLFVSLVNWLACRGYGHRSTMTTACVYQLPLFGLWKLSFMSWGLIGLPLGSTIISANYIRADVFNEQRRRGKGLTVFSLNPSS